ncbi:MAG TPA: hypothetical protein VGG61_07150, partial [Gemmataceae bacterium]
MLWWLAQNAVIGAVLAVLVAVACRVCRFRPAVRHALWLIVLVKLVAPPLLPWSWPPAEPRVAAPVQPDASPAVEDPQDFLVASAKSGSQISPEDLHAKWLAYDPAAISSDPIIPNTDRHWEPSVSLPAEPLPAATTEPATPVSAAVLAWFSGPAAESGLRLWLGAVAVMAGLQLVRTIRFRRRLARGRPAPRPLTGLVAEMADRLGIRPPAAVVVP